MKQKPLIIRNGFLSINKVLLTYSVSVSVPLLESPEMQHSAVLLPCVCTNFFCGNSQRIGQGMYIFLKGDRDITN